MGVLQDADGVTQEGWSLGGLKGGAGEHMVVSILRLLSLLLLLLLLLLHLSPSLPCPHNA